MRRKSSETVKIPALNYTKLVFCIIELDAWDRIFGATPAVNSSRKGAWEPAAWHAWQLSDTDGYSKMPHAALSSSQATVQVPMRFFTNFHASLASSRAFYRASHDFGKLPRNLVKLPCLMSRSCAVLPSLHATLANFRAVIVSSHASLSRFRAVLPASMRHRLIAHAPAAVKFLLRPCHAVFEFFRPPHQTAVGQRHRILAALSPL